MLEEFRQAPLRLKLDLDSYDGHWSHVARFRGRNGWVMGARATLESARDTFRTVIVVGCDEWDNPIPSFQAAHLLECTWSDLAECYEHPPEILSELLCEEEGQVYGRWQRETNAALQRHLIATEDRIAGVERATRRDTDRRLRQIDDLRRRRRFAGLTNDARTIFDSLIAELDADNDIAFEAARAEVASLRAAAERAEEGLWQRESVLIDVEPFCVVSWNAPVVSVDDRGLGRIAQDCAADDRPLIAFPYRSNLPSDPANAGRTSRHLASEERVLQMRLRTLERRLGGDEKVALRRPAHDQLRRDIKLSHAALERVRAANKLKDREGA